MARPQAALLTAECLPPLRVSVGEYGNPFATLRHYGLQFFQGVFRLLGGQENVKYDLTFLQNNLLHK